MGSRQLIEHMGLRGVLTSQARQAYADSPILNNAVAMSGDPKAPFLPRKHDNARPRQSNRATAEMLATLTSNQAYLRNRATNQGLSTNVSTLRPVLVAPYELARRGMVVNDLSLRESPAYRPIGAAVPAGRSKTRGQSKL